MFKDYYLILGISENVTQKEIKEAYIRQALRWHPDKNPGKNTTSKMQDVNEAYIILKDEEARCRYNIEYQSFKAYQRYVYEVKVQEGKSAYEKHKEKEVYDETTSPFEYHIKDDVLKRWVEKAKEQAIKLAQETLEDLIGMTRAGYSEMKKSFKDSIIWVIISIVATIIALIVIYS